MRYLVAMACLVVGLVLPSAAFGFHHVAVPGDDCAPDQADRNGAPGDNETAHAALVAAGLTLPLAPAGTTGDAHTPESCPAP